MTGPVRPSGIVLAGGRARRFGADKLAVELEGRPLLQHAIEAVAAVASEVIVVVGPGGMPSLPAHHDVPIRIARDARSDGGPLVGLIAGLEIAAADVVLAVGGDMPSLVPAVLRELGARGTANSAGALTDGDAIRPLPCAMPRDRALERAQALPATGRSSLRDLLSAIGVDGIPEAEWRLLDPAGDSLVDIDRPQDLVSWLGER